MANEIWLFPRSTSQILKRRRFQVVFVYRINSCCPSYVKKSSHLTKQIMHAPHCQNYKKRAIATRALRWKSFAFARLLKECHTSLHWDCILLFVEWNQTKKASSKATQNVENNERSHKREQQLRSWWFNYKGIKWQHCSWINEFRTNACWSWDNCKYDSNWVYAISRLLTSYTLFSIPPCWVSVRK